MKLSERYPIPEIPEFDTSAIADELSKEIELQESAMGAYVEEVIDARDFGPRRIATIQGNASFVAHAAVLRYFQRRDLLEQFYDDASTFRETVSGWDIHLQRPIPGGRLSETYQFSSRDLGEFENGTRHRFTLWFQLRKH